TSSYRNLSCRQARFKTIRAQTAIYPYRRKFPFRRRCIVIWLGREGVEEKLLRGGVTLTESEIEITREDRTASGKMVFDIITVKKLFTISYNIIRRKQLEQLERLYNLQEVLSLKIERENGDIDQYDVRFRPFERSVYKRPKQWLYRDITVELEEI